jgi:hypothetical protein
MIVERVNAGLARAKAKGIKLGRGNKKDGERSADEKRGGMSRAELEKRILRLYKGGTGILKIGKTLGIETALVQRVVTEQPRPFDVGVASLKHIPLSESKIANTRHRSRPARKTRWGNSQIAMAFAHRASTKPSGGITIP